MYKPKTLLIGCDGSNVLIRAIHCPGHKHKLFAVLRLTFKGETGANSRQTIMQGCPA